MRTTIYVIFTKSGGVTMRKSQPNIKRGEVAVKLKINVPDKFFTQPVPEVDVVIPEPAVMMPEVTVETDMDS